MARHVAGERWSTTGQRWSMEAEKDGQRWRTTGQPPPDHRSMVVNDGGQRRRSTTVNGGRPPLTIVGPPPDHRWNSGLAGSNRSCLSTASGDYGSTKKAINKPPMDETSSIDYGIG
ncbi:hypothetical protein Tco_1135396 [Tanacetum coccineum]